MFKRQPQHQPKTPENKLAIEETRPLKPDEWCTTIHDCFDMLPTSNYNQYRE